MKQNERPVPFKMCKTNTKEFQIKGLLFSQTNYTIRFMKVMFYGLSARLLL